MLSNSESVETKLQRIAEKARKEPNCQFTSLFHLMDMELLRGCFEGLSRLGYRQSHQRRIWKGSGSQSVQVG